MGEFSYQDLERSALGFVLETESWPVFLAWFRAQHVSPEAHDWLEAGPDLEKIRADWAAHSSNPLIRLLAGECG